MTEFSDAWENLKREVIRASRAEQLLDRLAAAIARRPRLAAVLNRVPPAPPWLGMMFWIHACVAVQIGALLIAWATGRLH